MNLPACLALALLLLVSGSVPAQVTGGSGSVLTGGPQPGAARGNDGVGGIEKAGGPKRLPDRQAPAQTLSLPGNTIATPAPSPWTDLGHALSGEAGLPELTGAGAPAPGATLVLHLAQGRPGAAALFVAGFERVDAPFKGGVMVPQPQIVVSGLPLDAQGALTAATTLPDLPGVSLPALVLHMQFWIADDTVAGGFSASNGLSLALGPEAAHSAP